jgi:hypothetical protein
MAHEGTHVAGNRIEAIAHLQGSGTYQAITAMFGLQGDDAFRGEMVEAILNPESWKENAGDTDYWKQVQREDGTYGALPDGNHSLLDEDGNVLIRSPLDIFDENGKIIGHEIETEKSYKRSFGMLMGLYPDFIQNDRTYEEYDTYVDAALADGSDSMLLTGINTAMANKAKDGSIGVNAYLMTLVGVVPRMVTNMVTGEVTERQGEGIRYSVREMYDGSMSLSVFIDIKDAKGGDAGTIGGSFIRSSSRADETNYVMVENMIPEGRSLKAGTFRLDSSGTVQMYGLGSTMPDPTMMNANNAAVADGVYPYLWAQHHVEQSNAYAAFRLFKTRPPSLLSVSGPKGKSPIENYPYNTEANNWGAADYRTGLSAYSYSSDGSTVLGTAWSIDGHHTYPNPYQYNITTNGTKYIAGSEGCVTWLPKVYGQLTTGLQTTKTPYRETWGKIIINRKPFGDGTVNGKGWMP